MNLSSLTNRVVPILAILLLSLLFLLGCDQPVDPRTDNPTSDNPPTEDPVVPEEPELAGVTVTGTFSTSVLLPDPQEGMVSASSQEWTGYEVWVCHWSSLTDYFYDSYMAGQLAYDTYSLNSDGSFSVTLPEGEKFVAFLVNPTAADRVVVGIVGIGIGDSTVIDSIDTSYFDDDMDLGTIGFDDSAASRLLSESTAETFVTDADALASITTLATIDDMVRMFENFLNYGFAPQYTESNVFYLNWSDVTPGTFTGAGAWQFAGAQVHTLWGSQGAPSSGVAEFYPPVSISWGDETTFSSTSPCVFTMVTDERFSERAEFGYGENGNTLFQELPEGYYRLTDGTNTLAEFHGGLAPPLLEDGRIGVAHPSFRIVSNDSGLIEYIEVNWYIPSVDGSGYDQISLELLEEYRMWGHVELTDFNTEEVSEEGWTRSQEGNSVRYTPSLDWYLDSESAISNDAYWADYFGFSYGTLGQSIRFAVRSW